METRLASLSGDYEALNDKVTRLRPETLDPDMLEEYSIHMLGHGTASGIILLDGES